MRAPVCGAACLLRYAEDRYDKQIPDENSPEFEAVCRLDDDIQEDLFPGAGTENLVLEEPAGSAQEEKSSGDGGYPFGPTENKFVWSAAPCSVLQHFQNGVKQVRLRMLVIWYQFWNATEQVFAFPVAGGVEHVVLLGDYKSTGIVVDHHWPEVCSRDNVPEAPAEIDSPPSPRPCS